jgi:hypothetical protein
MKQKKQPPQERLDLLIVDIDDTFIYHRTVAIGNAMFLTLIGRLFRTRVKTDRLYSTFATIKEALRIIFTRMTRFEWHALTAKRIFFLLWAAIRLHFLNLGRRGINRIYGTLSNEYLVNIWANTVKRISIPESLYQLEDKVIVKNIYTEIHGIYRSLKRIHPKMKVLAISEHFSVRKDPIHKILDIDHIETNLFKTGKKGEITDPVITIANAEDKLNIAKKYVRQHRAKHIGLIIEDWDDIGLLELEGIKLVLYKPRLKRFIPKGVEKRVF